MNDEPIRMAGGGLGLSPMSLRDGFDRESLRELVSRVRLPRLDSPEDVAWAMNGAYEPREAFGV
jgi:hypothetical protein